MKLVTKWSATSATVITASPSSIALRRPMRTPTTPAGRAPKTPPMAHAMKPMVTSSGRTPNRSVPCRENQVVNVWKVSCTRKVAAKTARMPGSSPLSAVHTAPPSERNVVSTVSTVPAVPASTARGEATGSRSATLNVAAIASTVIDPTRNAVRIPRIRPSIRNTTAPTHIWNVTDPVAKER